MANIKEDNSRSSTSGHTNSSPTKKRGTKRPLEDQDEEGSAATKKQRSTTISPSNIQLSDNPVCQDIRDKMLTMLDTYVTIFSHGFPFMNQQQIREMIKFICTLSSSPSEREQQQEKKPFSTIDILLFMSIECFTFQRLGHKLSARRIYQQSSILMGDYLKKSNKHVHLSNDDKINLACAQASLAYYLAGEGGEENIHKCKMYSNAAEYYIYLAKKDLDKEQRRKCKLAYKYLALVELMTKIKFCDYRDGINCLSKLISGITETSVQPPASVHDFDGLLQYVSEAESILHNYWINKMSHQSSVIFHFYYRIIANGIRLQIMYASPDHNQEALFDFAGVITEDIAKHILLFTYCPAPIQYVALAAKIHLIKANTLQNELLDERLLRYLKLDLFHLEIIGSKFDVVFHEFNNLLNDLRRVIKDYETKSNIQMFIDHPYTPVYYENTADSTTDSSPPPLPKEYNDLFVPERFSSQQQKPPQQPPQQPQPPSQIDEDQMKTADETDKYSILSSPVTPQLYNFQDEEIMHSLFFDDILGDSQ